MGCTKLGGLYNVCASGEAVHNAMVITPLVGLDDGTTLIALGNEKRGSLNVEIVKMDSAEASAYEGANKITPNQFGGLDLADVRVAALEQARPIMLRGMGIGESAPDEFRGGPMTFDRANNVFEKYGIESVTAFVSRAAQRANDLRAFEEDIFDGDGDGQIDIYERAILGTYEIEARAAGDALDKLKMVDNLPAIAPILIEAINAHDDITPEQKSFLRDDINMGGQDAGFQVSDPAAGMEFK